MTNYTTITLGEVSEIAQTRNDKEFIVGDILSNAKYMQLSEIPGLPEQDERGNFYCYDRNGNVVDIDYGIDDDSDDGLD